LGQQKVFEESRLVNSMTPSEELVYNLCNQSFLSLWSYANPKGKKGKELCDVLVVCDPDIIIFSVKEVEYKDTGDNVGLERWRKKAIDESCGQIYGAERWINSEPNIITNEGQIALPFPDVSNRRIHRVAVALGSNRKFPVPPVGLEKGFVHILDETSLSVLLNELDTISDFVEYLTAKEDFLRSGTLQVILGGEEDLLALYLTENNQFPSGASSIVLEEGLWDGFSKEEIYLAEKQENEISYIWDEIIEEIHQTHLISNFITGDGYATELPEMEKAVRIMARENRFSRRLLSSSLTDFIQTAKSQNIKARISLNKSSLDDLLYVFQISSYDTDRRYNRLELQARCIVARGLNQDKRRVVGMMFEFSEIQPGSTTTLCLLDIEQWMD
jgi:hypothetical protein